MNRVNSKNKLLKSPENNFDIDVFINPKYNIESQYQCDETVRSTVTFSLDTSAIQFTVIITRLQVADSSRTSTMPLVSRLATSTQRAAFYLMLCQVIKIICSEKHSRNRERWPA